MNKTLDLFAFITKGYLIEFVKKAYIICVIRSVNTLLDPCSITDNGIIHG